MNAHHLKLTFCLLVMLSLFAPSAVNGMPAPAGSECSLLLPSSRVAPTDTTSVPHPSTPHEVEIKADKAVYVDEQNPNMKWGDDDHLRVGIGTEFGGELRTLIQFGPVWESDGGPVPNGAEITEMRVKLYKESGPSGTVKLQLLGGDFNEGSVTWDTKPSLHGSSHNTSVPAANGWCYINAGEAGYSYLFNYGVALLPTWTDIGRAISFTSDEHPSRGPSLVISYLGAAPPPEPPSAPPPAEDTRQCELTWTITPEHPRVGDSVTITATATDDQAMWYVKIMRASSPLARQDAIAGQREVTVSYTETAVLPSLTYTIIADDLGEPPAVGSPIITVPVVGTGTAPEVTVTAEWLDVEEVIPDRYRLIKNDGQRVIITAEASDPDGIRDLHIFINGIDHPFTYTDRTSVRQSVEWVNNQPTRTRFYYYAQARDRENQTTTGEGGDHDIAQPQDIRLIWHETPPDANFGLDDIPFTLPWGRMCQIFGDGECWYVEGWGWRDSSAENYWEDNIRNAGDGGQCFGFSTMATELYNGRIAASELDEVTGGAWELDYSEDTFPGSGNTGVWIQARQAGWFGEEVLIPRYDRGGREMGARATLNMVEYDLEADEPGVIGIWQGGSGHAVVPWMVRYMPDDTVRIYIYDCNDVRGIHNANADINTFAHYPYIVIDDNDWSYDFSYNARTGVTTVWDDDIEYINYEEACGDMGQAVTEPPIATEPGYSYRTPYLTDHDIPNSTDWYVAWVTPGADAYFEDEEGNITGIYKGQLREEIPGSMAVNVPMIGGLFTDHEMYIMPRDKKLFIHAVGTSDGEYNLGILGDSTFYGIRKKNIRQGLEDYLGFEPWKDSLGYRLSIQPGVADDNFKVMVCAKFAGLVAALNEESIDREYAMEDVSATEDSDFSVFVEEGGSTFVVESYGDDITFDAVTRSTESADYLDPNVDHGYIPSSVQEDVTLERGRRAEMTPENWATDEERGTLHTLNKGAKGEGGGFPLIPVIIGLVVVAAGVTVGVLFGKGILGKKAEPVKKVTKAKKVTKNKRGRRTKA